MDECMINRLTDGLVMINLHQTKDARNVVLDTPSYDPKTATRLRVRPDSLRTTNTIYGTTNTVYGTTFMDAGVGIALKRGTQKFDKKKY